MKNRIGWIDLLRIIACFFVVASHCSDPFLASDNESDFLGSWFIGSIARCSVPLFVMISGSLLLPTSLKMDAFYVKRIKRLAVPLIFWSITLPFLFYAYINYGDGSSFPLLDAPSYTIKSTFYKAFTFFLNFNYDTTPLWYLYMLLGLYFIVPILSIWVKNVSRNDIRRFLIIWGITLCLPYAELITIKLNYVGYPGNSGIFGVCDWNIFGTFYYVSGFIGYLILGYYLKTYPLDWSWKKTWSICLPSLAIGVGVTFGSLPFLFTHMPEHISYAWLFCVAHVFMITFPIFVIVQKSEISQSEILSKIASNTFGIYLCHFIFIHIGYDVCQRILPANTSSIIHVTCNSTVSFAASYALVTIMRHFKLTKRLVE